MVKVLNQSMLLMEPEASRCAAQHAPTRLLETDMNLSTMNQMLEGESPEQIIRSILALGKGTLLTTTFGDQSAVLLHMATQICPELQVLWIDTGYNTSATYRFSDLLIRRLDLNMQIYIPQMTSARRNVLMGGVPDIDDSLHAEFSRQVKIEPFQLATRHLRPEFWITGIRRDQTEFRRSLDTLSRTNEGYVKVAPLLDWNNDQMNDYLAKYDLPNETDYFDPTKAYESRECGLQTLI